METKEQILKDASLQAKQIHEELIEEAKRTAGGLDEKAREEAKNQEDKEAEKLKDVIEELKVSAREKKDVYKRQGFCHGLCNDLLQHFPEYGRNE